MVPYSGIPGQWLLQTTFIGFNARKNRHVLAANVIAKEGSD